MLKKGVFHLLPTPQLQWFTTFLLIFCAVASSAQEEREKYYNLNQPNFDYRKYHFGFNIGLNQSDFIVSLKPDYFDSTGLLLLQNDRLPGFNLGIVSVYKLNPNVWFKFIPTLSFQDRKLTYRFMGGPDSAIVFTKIVEATFVELPVYVKLRTNRIGNFAAYMIGGGKFMLDMSNKKTDDLVNDRDLLVRINKRQYAVEFGGGMDFFLPYFKFGIELKMSLGIGDVMIRDDTRFTRPLNSLRTKGYILTLTFEG